MKAPQTLMHYSDAWPLLAIHPVASDEMDYKLFSWLLLLSLSGKTCFSVNLQFIRFFKLIFQHVVQEDHFLLNFSIAT